VIKRVAHGVVLVVAPWNYPYITTINSIAPALIAGNSVVLKHASQTPLVGLRIAQAFHSIGIPEDVFQNLVPNHQTTAELISRRAFGFVNFTGSVGGGKAIERAASGTFTSLSLELQVRDDAAAITLMNDSNFGLKASLWTKDPERAEAIADQIETGTVFMNRADYLDPALCWTGCKDTGRGGSLSIIGYHNLTRPKSYHLKKA
jgi:acyl-CoA reductase-like NAD-dependent aldehyde dehydrogenase